MDYADVVSQCREILSSDMDDERKVALMMAAMEWTYVWEADALRLPPRERSTHSATVVVRNRPLPYIDDGFDPSAMEP